MSERTLPLEVVFRLPVPSWPRAVFRSTYGYNGGELSVDGQTVLSARSRAEIERGVSSRFMHGRHQISMRLDDNDGSPNLTVEANGQPAAPETELTAPPSRSAWYHGFIALAASAAGFGAGYLYLLEAQTLNNAWSLKMSYHMAAWHVLLTVTLFPASVWGQRIGIRAVQFVSLVFFLIHIGIAIANLGPGAQGPGIAVLNALSGALFAVAVVYGQRAHADMDPVAALPPLSTRVSQPSTSTGTLTG